MPASQCIKGLADCVCLFLCAFLSPTPPLLSGTGKTSTIVHAIRALVASGASVLVTSYTNSALDNILLKLVDCGVHEFVRLGRHSSCHPGVQEYMPGGARWVRTVAVAQIKALPTSQHRLTLP